MSLKDLPSNKNPLSLLGYKFVLSRLPSTTFFCQAVNLPGVSLNHFTTPNPLIKFNLAGTELNFGTLALTFKVDEDMSNYLELFNWMCGLGFPEDLSQYASLYAGGEGNGGISNDATLLITTSAKNPNISIEFHDVFPVAVSGINFDSRATDVEYVTASAEFSIRDFKVTVSSLL